jgi:5-methyltetrahydropteroyltriglutamate--homocysteine methyltransferase
MKTSRERILTTHVGSLPRSEGLSDLLIRQERGEAIDNAALARETEAGVSHVVRKQVESGIDVISDGEQPRVGFQTYAPQRLSGFGGAGIRPSFLDFEKFPDYGALLAARIPKPSKVFDAPAAIGEIGYIGKAQTEAECALFEKCSAPYAGRHVERFMTAASPGIICTTMMNHYFDTHERYLRAVAKAMQEEYQLIHSRGLVLQLDCPDLAMERQGLFKNETEAGFIRAIELHVDALNSALENIPAGNVRLHVCYGNYDGPHYHDVPLEVILPVLYQAKVGALSLEMANPRHQHEYDVLKKVPPPDPMILVPGVVESASNYIEHPQVICNRVLQAVDAVGDRERVIASSDCGFGTFAGWEFVAQSVVWAKFEAMREGAELATRKLWG